MRILINCIAFQTAGTWTIGTNLIASLARIDRNNEYVVVAPAGAKYEELNGNNVRVLTFNRRRFYYLWRFWFEQFYIPLLCIKNKINIYLNLNNIPMKYSPIPQILMFQQFNLITSNICNVPIKDKILFEISKALFRFGINSVSCLIVQTPIVAKCMLETYKFRPDRIKTIESGHEINSNDNIIEEKRIANLFNGQNINVVCLARYYPHKNLEMLLGVAKLIKKEKLPVKIFLTIEKGHHPWAKKMLSNIIKYGLGDIIINLGYLNKAETITAYQRATIFVLPTLLECFGLTYLEAMCAGCPIATSDRDFSRYICGEAALYFNPDSAESILKAICQIGHNNGLREKLIKEGYSRLKNKFNNWDEVAKKYISLIEQVYLNEKSK